MIQYLKADLWRINRRIPRLVTVIIYLLIGIALTLSLSKQNIFNFVKLGDRIVSTLKILPFLTGMVNLYFVFEDDLQTKTLQTAIGRGTKRYAIIFTKWFEMLVLAFADCALLTVVMWFVGLTKGVTLKGAALTNVMVQLVITCLTIGVITSLTMIMIFQIMNLGLTQLIFCLLAIKPISAIFNYIEMQNEIMAKIRLSRVLLGSNLNSLQTSLSAGRFSMENFVFIFIYWAIGMGVTCLLFKKKELDF